MKEQLISFKTAKLAQFKGFPDLKKGYHFESNGTRFWTNKKGGLSGKENTVQIVSQGLLQRWLREKHKIHLFVKREFFNGKCIGFSCTIDNKEGYTELKEMKKYEQSLEKGLQEALKLIK